MINKAGLNLIKEFEGLKDGDKNKPNLQPYMALEGQLTTGWGHVLLPEDDWMKEGITETQAEEILVKDMAWAEKAVDKLVAIPINDNERGALVSFVFNAGEGALSQSTLLRLLNEGVDKKLVAAEFLKWNKYTPPGKKRKVESAGLTRRRQAEARLFMTAPQQSLRKSATMLITGGAVLPASGMLFLESVKPIADTIEEVAVPMNIKLKEHGIDLPNFDPFLGGVIFLGSIGLIYSKIQRHLHEKENRGVHT